MSRTTLTTFGSLVAGDMEPDILYSDPVTWPLIGDLRPHIG